MTERAWRALVLVCFTVLGGCTCEPESQASGDTVESSSEEVSEGSATEGSASAGSQSAPPVLAPVATLDLPGRGIGLLPGPSGVAVSLSGGALHVYDQESIESGQPSWQLNIDAELVEAQWLNDTIYAVDGTGGMLVRSTPSTGETARLALGGAGSDLWIDRERDWVWVLARGETESNLVAIELSPEHPDIVGEIRGRVPVGTAPVNIVPSPDGTYVAVPGFRDREVYLIRTEEPRLERAVPVSFRPARAEFDPAGRLVVTSANLTNAMVIVPDGRVPEGTVELPGSVSLLQRSGDDRLVAYSPARSRIWSWSDIEGQAKESDEVGIITSMASGGDWLVAAQANPSGSLVVLDRVSLDLLGTVELEGQPSDVRLIHDRQVWVLLPTRQQIVVYEPPAQ